MDTQFVTNKPYVFPILGKLGSGKSTLIEKILNKNLGISNASMLSQTKVINTYNSDDNKIILIDTPGYGDPDKKLDLRNLNLLSEYLATQPYISNVCIMVEMSKRLDYDMFNCVKTYWNIINKNTDIRLLIILTGANLNQFNENDIKTNFRSFISNSGGANYYNLRRLKYNLLLVKDQNSYNVPQILDYLKRGSLSFSLSHLITYHSSHFIQGYNEEINKLNKEINDALSSYLRDIGVVFDQVNYDNNRTHYYKSGVTYDDYIKQRKRRIQILVMRIDRIKNTNTLYITDLGRCHGKTLKKLRCKNSRNCYHHPEANRNK